MALSFNKIKAIKEENNNIPNQSKLNIISNIIIRRKTQKKDNKKQ